ncbi:MAG: LacI family DNA-binding transcriptional regulator [Pseudomonadota bacterium]
MKKRQRTGKTVKIEDVAHEAEVSIMTVSRALRGVEGVSEIKRAQIFDIAEKLRYQPNLNARSLVNVQSSLIGISFPTLFNDVFAEMLDGMRPTLESAGFTTIVTTTEYDRAREVDWINTVRPWRPAALVLTGTDHDERVRRVLRRDQTPTLELWEHSDDPIDISVGINHSDAGREIADAMIALGYMRPAFVGFDLGHDLRAEKRLLGIRSAFLAQGLGDVRTARHGTIDGYRAGYDGIKTLAAEKAPMPDVVFFLSDHFAFAGLMACMELGLNVPNDIGIVGFNSLSVNSVLPQRLTTVKTPRREMGTLGARGLIARINGVQNDLSHRLSPEIIYGDTTRKPGGNDI